MLIEDPELMQVLPASAAGKVVAAKGLEILLVAMEAVAEVEIFWVAVEAVAEVEIFWVAVEVKEEEA